MTTGLMEWGQAGTYNAIDDRNVITALAGSGGIGMIIPAKPVAASGLNFTVPAGWLAMVNCGDGTRGIVGSNLSATVAGAAGPPTGSRIDALWVDVNVAAGTWTMSIIPESSTAGRTGVELARITVPALANTAAAMTVDQSVATFGAKAVGGVINNTTTSMNALTPHYPIPPYNVKPNSLYRIKAWGNGVMAATVNNVRFRCADANSPLVTLACTGVIAVSAGFSWHCQIEYMVNPDGASCSISVQAMVGKGRGSSATDSTTAGAPDWVGSTKSIESGSFDPSQWHTLEVQGGWTSALAPQDLRCSGSIFETFIPYT